MLKNFPKLALPEINARIEVREEELYIFDNIRKKFIFLTKEEWVRQHFVQLMIDQLKYPKGLIQVETGLTYFRSKKRSDIVLFDTSAQPFLLVECKSPEIKMGKSTLTQLAVYNKVLNAKYVAITNGLKHFVWQKKESHNDYDSLSAFPKFEN